MEHVLAIVLQRLDAALIDEEAVERHQTGRELQVLDGRQLAGDGILQRVDVHREPVLEEPAERLEDAAVEGLEITGLEELGQAARPEHDADRPIRRRREIAGEPIELEVVGDEHRLARRGDYADPREEIEQVELALRQQVVHRELHQRERLLAVGKLFLESIERARQHVEVHVRDRPEAPALDQHRPLPQRFGGL